MGAQMLCRHRLIGFMAAAGAAGEMEGDGANLHEIIASAPGRQVINLYSEHSRRKRDARCCWAQACTEGVY